MFPVSSTAVAAVTCGSDRVLGMATLVEAPDDVLVALERKVLDTSTSLSEKYRVLFSLRNVAGTAATKALIAGGYDACATCLSGRTEVTYLFVFYLSLYISCLLQSTLGPLHRFVSDNSTAAPATMHM